MLQLPNPPWCRRWSVIVVGGAFEDVFIQEFDWKVQAVRS